MNIRTRLMVIAGLAASCGPALADDFSFGFSYNSGRHYRTYVPRTYVYRDYAPVVVYRDYYPDVVVYPAPRVRYYDDYRPRTVVYRDYGPRAYYSPRTYVTRSCGPSYRSHRSAGFSFGYQDRHRSFGARGYRR